MKAHISVFPYDIGGYPSAYILAQAGQPLRVVGVLSLELDNSAAFIRSLFVDARCRGVGIGTQLLEQSFMLAREQGFETVGLHAAETDERVLALYQRLGFRQYLKGYEGYKSLIKLL